MLSKRFALIVGGTIGGLGAVVSITPPQFGSSGGLAAGSLSGASLSGSSAASASQTTSSSAATSTAPTATPAAAPAATNTPASTTTTKKKAKKKKAATSTTNSAASTTSANATAQSATPTPVATTAAPKAASGVSGTSTGAAADTRFGPVQVQITISNGKITNVTAPQYPTESFRDQQINAQAIPYLIQETLQAQSANIQGVGGASYTSEGFYQSLVSALSKAGMS